MTEPFSRQERSPSSVPDWSSVPPERAHAMAELLSRQESKDPSATPRRLPVPLEHTRATTDSPTLPQPESGPRQLAKSKSRIHGNEGVDHGAERAVNGPSSEGKEQKRIVTSEERENHPKGPATTEPSPYLKAPSVQRAHSNRSRGHNSSAQHLPDTSDFRGNSGRVGPSPNSTPPLDRSEAPITPEFVSTQNQPKPNKSSVVLTTFRLTADTVSLFVCVTYSTAGTSTSNYTIQTSEGI
jgi:hypothetical protein